MTLHVLSATAPSPAGVAVLVALGSAVCFATSNALQHRVAGTVPATLRRPLAVLAHLAHRPLWLVATMVSCTALTLHAAALRLGSIALVQPLMLVGVVLAVPLRAALDRALPTPRELRAVAVTAIGLGLFLACANPTPSTVPASPLTAAVMTVSAAGATLAGLRALRGPLSDGGPPLAAALGAAAGVMFGLTAGLLKLLGNAVAAHDSAP